MNKYFWKIFHLVNKIFMKGFRADGWCYVGYKLNRSGFYLKEEGWDDWIEMPQNPISAWRGAFMRIYKNVNDMYREVRK